MADTGSLIKLHYHQNQTDVLDFLSVVNGNLYFKNAPIYIHVSEDEKNAIVKLPDGIFVDKSYFLTKAQYDVLTQFKFENSLLYFGEHIISWDYTYQQIQLTNKEVWDALNVEYPQDDIVTEYMSTADNKIFMTADHKVFLAKEVVV